MVRKERRFWKNSSVVIPSKGTTQEAADGIVLKKSDFFTEEYSECGKERRDATWRLVALCTPLLDSQREANLR